MSQTVIADASCLIILQNIKRLDLLESLFGEIFITRVVEAEFGLSLPNWIKVETVQDLTRQTLLEINLDKGEASSITLCLEKTDCLLVIDERKGRRIAKQLNLKIVGTLGIIIKAKESGLIDSLSEILDELESVGFHLSKNLKDKLLD